jgi:2'-5' RNA ligase
MSFAISLKAANRTARFISDLWDKVARFESAPSMAALNYPPHVTLAVYDDIHPDQLEAALLASFAGVPALRLTFTRLRFFDNAPLVLWADPAYSPALADAHTRVHACIDPTPCRPHYRPGAWVPHCTLGTRILEERRAEAVAFTAEPMEAFGVLFDAADCISFPPVRVMSELTLERLD